MTHNEKRVHWMKEGAIGLGVGVLYGLTSVAVGHPLDTIKTKMQAQKGFESRGLLQTLRTTFRTQGIKGFYRGCVPPLWGSGIYRSVQFAVFEAGYTYMDNPYGHFKMPGSGGLEVRVIAAALLAGSSRALIESPLELVKTRRQTQQNWRFKELYKGFGITWVRTLGLLTSYFILVDSGRRHFPDQFGKPLLGPFLTSALAATTAWWIVWPLEYMKAQVQGNYGQQDVSVLKRMHQVIRERGGYLALYRGILPGTLRSFISNGISMVVMVHAQRKVTDWGLRGNS